jgi:hypothetical protein
MKLLLVFLTFAVASHSHAEVKRVKQLDSVKGIQYIDTEQIFEDQKLESISIRDLVAIAPPKEGTAYRVRVVNWKPNGKLRAIWTYQLTHDNGAYQFQRLYSSQKKIDVKPGDSVLYYTNP